VSASLVDRIRGTAWAWLGGRSPAETVYTVLIPVLGLATGFVTLGIAHVLFVLQELFWGSGEDLLAGAQASPGWHRLLIPVIGGAGIGLLALLLRRDPRGSGTSGLIHALALRGGHISVRQEWPAVIAGILTVSSGGSLGREGPMIEFASVMGSRLGRLFQLDQRQVRVLVCCAAGAAISAVYNAPIGGTIFVMEILIGTFALDIFGPVVIASVLATLVFRGAMGQLPRFVIPAYELVSVWELVGYLALGTLCGVFSVAVIESIGWMGEAFRRLDLPGPVRPIVGFLIVGLIGLELPYVFGNGYETVNLALHEALPLWLLLVLPVAKLAATAITRASGGSGGVFTPTLMLGALVGGAFGHVVHGLFPAHTAEYGAYALVGMGAVLAGTTHAPIMAIIMIFEQTNSYSIILPLMFTCTVSNLMARRMKSESLHLDTLRRRGIVLPTGPEAAVMGSLRVADVMHDDVDSVDERAPMSLIIDHFLRTPRNYLYVTGDDARFLGAVPLHAIKDVLATGRSLDIVLAADLVEPFEAVSGDDYLADVMDKFWRQNSHRLPVLSGDGSGRLIGWMSQRDLIGVYSQEVLQKGQRLARFTVRNDAGREHGQYVELPEGFEIRTFVVPPALHGGTVAEVVPRSTSGIYVLQIRRYDPFRRRQPSELPGPDSILRAHDRIVVIGSDAGMERMRRILATAGGGGPGTS
jgi:CIC family chloride channel protein